MRIEYSKRAIADLRAIAAHYAASNNPRAGERLAERIREVVARLARLPQSGRPVIERPGVRVIPLLRYRYNIFYAASEDAVRILHIRHTSRTPWRGE